MGVLPLEFTGGDNRKTLGLKGDEVISICGPRRRPEAAGGGAVRRSSTPTAGEREIELKCRIDTAVEIEYVENGGVLHYVLRNLHARRLRRPPGAAAAASGRSRRLDSPARPGPSTSGRNEAPKGRMRLARSLISADPALRAVVAGRRACRCRTAQRRRWCSSSTPARAARPARRPTRCSTELAAKRRGDRAGAACRLLGLSRLEGRFRPARRIPPGSAPTPRRRAAGRIFTPEMIVQGDERLKGHDAAAHPEGDRAPAAAAAARRGEPGARRRCAGDPPRAHRRRAGRARPRSIWCASCRRRTSRSAAARTPGAMSPTPTSSPTGTPIGHWDGAAPVDLRAEDDRRRPARGHRPGDPHGAGADRRRAALTPA